MAPDQAFAGDDRECPEIGAIVDRAAAAHLLWTHVLRGAQERSELRADDLADAQSVRLHLGDAKIDELRDFVPAFAHEKDVSRLHVAMNDAHRMRLTEAPRHLA